MDALNAIVVVAADMASTRRRVRSEFNNRKLIGNIARVLLSSEYSHKSGSVTRTLGLVFLNRDTTRIVGYPFIIYY
jgi:hypothetical protein